jgi:hypothetical protein
VVAVSKELPIILIYRSVAAETMSADVSIALKNPNLTGLPSEPSTNNSANARMTGKPAEPSGILDRLTTDVLLRHSGIDGSVGRGWAKEAPGFRTGALQPLPPANPFETEPPRSAEVSAQQKTPI